MDEACQQLEPSTFGFQQIVRSTQKRKTAQMTSDPRAALREKVARAVYNRWRGKRPNAPAFDCLYEDALESELSDADAAIAVCLEEAARMIETRWQHGTGDHQAAAIRGLKGKD
jgi:hypothetical protein